MGSARLLPLAFAFALLASTPLAAQPKQPPPASPPLAATIPPASPEVVAAVQRHLQALSDPARPPDEALRALAALGAPALSPLLQIAAAPDAGWGARSAAAWALGEIGDARALPPLRALFDALPPDAPATFRVQLAGACGALQDTAPLRALLAPGATPDKVVLAKAATLLASYRDAEAIPLLRPHLQDPDVGVFFALALGRLGDASVHPQLKEALRDGVLRDHAAIALGLSGDTTVVYQLRFALKNPDPFVRRDAVEGLGRLKDAESLAALESLASGDPDGRVREVAAKVVKRLKPRGRAR